MAERVVVLRIHAQQHTGGGKDPDREVFRSVTEGRGERIKAPRSLQALRRRIYHQAKSDKPHRFWGSFVPVAKLDTLTEAYPQAKRNGGAPGLDGHTFADREAGGPDQFLASLRDELLAGPYQPHPKRAVEIPKEKGKGRTLQIPGIGERVVPGALKRILEAICEADFCPNSYGYRPPRSPQQAVAEVRRSLLRRRSTVMRVDLARYCDTLRHDLLLPQSARRVQAPAVLHLGKQIVKAGGKRGVPPGGPFSPWAANIYLNEGDWACDASRHQTAHGPYEAVNER